MSKINGIFKITGQSGKVYAFTMYTTNTSFKHVDRLCVFTNRKPKGDRYTHEIIDIQHITDLAELKIENLYPEANCICVRIAKSATDDEIEDIKNHQ